MLADKNIEKEESYRKNKELFPRKQKKNPILPTISISPRMHYLTFLKPLTGLQY